MPDLLVAAAAELAEPTVLALDKVIVPAVPIAP